MNSQVGKHSKTFYVILIWNTAISKTLNLDLQRRYYEQIAPDSHFLHYIFSSAHT